MLDRSVVLVGVNYRLGPLGWLSLGCEEAPGNLGLWDQRLALLWVREHISAFGGDPSNVTLMGESAGAMAAMLHLAAPPSAGLFHRVVALSGTPSNPLLSQSRKPAVYAKALAARLGCDENADNQTILKFLQGVKATKILSNALMFMDWDFGNPLPWVPVDDSDLDEPFLPMDFHKAVKAGKVARVPVIMGCCRDEGLILSGPFHRDQKRLELLTRWARCKPLVVTCHPSGNGSAGLHCSSLAERGGRLVRWRFSWQGLQDQHKVSTLHSSFREVREMYWPSTDRETTREDDLARLKDIYGFDTVCYIFATRSGTFQYISGTPTSFPQWIRTVDFWHPKIFQFSLLSSPNQHHSPCPHSSLFPSQGFPCSLQKWLSGVSLLGRSVMNSSISDH